MRILIDYDTKDTAACVVANFEYTNKMITSCHWDWADIKNLENLSEDEKKMVSKALRIIQSKIE